MLVFVFSNMFYCYLNLESTKTLSDDYHWETPVLLLLKSWEYKNSIVDGYIEFMVLLLLKSWEYKNTYR